MPSGRFLIVLMGIILAILSLCKLDFGTSQPIVENWWGATQFTPISQPGAKLPNGQTVAIGGNYMANPNMGSGKFVSTPAFQAVLSPRFSNVQYGANIRYNMPDRENLGVPCEPLTFGSMAGNPTENYMKERSVRAQAPIENYSSNPTFTPKIKEGYDCATGQCAGGSPPSCGKGGYGFGHKVAGGYELPSGYAAGNYWDVYDSIPGTKIAGSELPVGTMSTMDGAGNLDQVVVVNNIMPANISGSRLRAQGDPIRGDLAIVPCQSGWFSVYPTLNRDLQAGSLAVLAGAGGGGESYNNLMNLLVSASGGATTTLGGVDLKESLPQYNANMATSMVTDLRNAMGDVTVSAFP